MTRAALRAAQRKDVDEVLDILARTSSPLESEAVRAAYGRYPVTPGYVGDKFIDDIYRAVREGFIVGYGSRILPRK